MNKLVLSALAASVAIGTTNASEGDWAGLDAELNTLTTSLDNHGGPAISGYLEAVYDTDTGDVNGNDAEDAGDNESNFTNARRGLGISGSTGGYGYNVDFNGAGMNDAYLNFEMGGMGWTMGQFRAPTTMNHLVNEEDMHFMDRSGLGGGGTRTNGLMASGDMSGIGYWIHVGSNEELSARFSYEVMGGDGINVDVAYSMTPGDGGDEENDDHGWIEANISSGAFGLSVTMGDAEDNLDAITGAYVSDGNDDAMVLTASYDVNDTWALGIRSNDAGGDGDESNTMDWAVTYADGGARWTIQTNDSDELMLGCIVGF